MRAKPSMHQKKPRHRQNDFFRGIASGWSRLPGKRWIIAGLAVVVTGTVLGLVRVDILDTRFFVARNPSPLLAPQRPLVQEFQVRGRLRRLEINFGTHNTLPRGRVQIQLQKGSDTVYTTEIAGEHIQGNRFTAIPISERVLRGTYRMFLTYHPAGPGEKLSVWLSRKDQYPRGRLWVNGKLHSGDMLFRAYYQAGVWEGAQVLTQRFHICDTWILWLLLGVFSVLTGWTLKIWILSW